LPLTILYLSFQKHVYILTSVFARVVSFRISKADMEKLISSVRCKLSLISVPYHCVITYRTKTNILLCVVGIQIKDSLFCTFVTFSSTFPSIILSCLFLQLANGNCSCNTVRLHEQCIISINLMKFHLSFMRLSVL
jgi:hypothetical protein